MQCTNCKSELLATAKFCPECGKKVENKEKKCPNKVCNRMGLPEAALFCPDCGAKLNKLEKKKIRKEKKITGSSSFSSGRSGLVGAHLFGFSEPKPVEEKQISTSRQTSTNQTTNYSSSSYKESNWDKFTHWLEWDVWWEIKHNGWRYLIDIVIVLLAGACIVNFPKGYYAIPPGLLLISFVHEI